MGPEMPRGSLETATEWPRNAVKRRAVAFGEFATLHNVGIFAPNSGLVDACETAPRRVGIGAGRHRDALRIGVFAESALHRGSATLRGATGP